MKKMLLLMAALFALGLSSCSGGSSSDNPYITFKSIGPFSIKEEKKEGKTGWNDTVEYSKNADEGTWTVWDGSSVPAELAEDGCYYLYFRGQGNNVITGGPGHKWQITGPDGTGHGTAACCGNIMTLLNYNDPDSAKMDDSCYSYMFNGCTGLTEAPELPAAELAEYCYCSMFSLCTGLTEAPELPAAELTDSCYAAMFNGCTGLTEAPELPAKTLADSCYTGMFNGCTGLTEAPELPAKTLADSCYFNMFNGCTGLTEVPELPAKTLAVNCYKSMFYKCTGLTSAPELPAAALADSCYFNMFNGCTGLTEVPELPAAELAKYCYDGMFRDCTGLTEAPELSAAELAEYCYHSMFLGCTGLKINNNSIGTLFLTMPQSFPLNAVSDMFSGTGGSFTSTPDADGKYYYE